MDDIAKLYFRWGTMDSSKTARLLMDAHEYEQREEFALLLKPVEDTRSSTGMIESRVGLSAPCVDFERNANLFQYLSTLETKPACIFVDEAQFLTFHQVINLRMIVDVLGIPVMCYGLKTDFLGNLFEGSQSLFAHANRNEEIKTICRQEGCRHKAMYNGRFKDGKPVFEGETVAIGDTKENQDSYYYIPKCSTHFFQDYMHFDNEKKERLRG